VVTELAEDRSGRDLKDIGDLPQLIFGEFGLRETIWVLEK
jgi:hypothetical protein